MCFMVGNIQAAIDSLLIDFPPLRITGNFHQNSNPDARYNCIGWALGLNDLFVASDNVPWHWWPSGISRDFSENSLLECFKCFGFLECDDATIEPSFDKVALYSLNGQWTHAARVIDVDRYHSKFGYNVDGFHKSGNVLSTKYGTVYKFMKRPLNNRGISLRIRNTLPAPQDYVHAANGKIYAFYDGKLYPLPNNRIV